MWWFSSEPSADFSHVIKINICFSKKNCNWQWVIRRNEVWILTVPNGSKWTGGKHEIISESRCLLKIKSISILDITSFRKINQRWNKISLSPFCLFTKFCFLNTLVLSKRQRLFSPLQGPIAWCACSGSHSQGLFSASFTRYFHFLLPLLSHTFPFKQHSLNFIHSCNTHF